MERAFQRQVIYGGSLDTILLEMGLIDEKSLSDYLSLATGLPPATRDHMDVISSRATELCDESKARQFDVAPLALDGDALRVLVCEPVDFAQLEDLADALDMAIQPLVAAEFRFHLSFSRAFASDGDARFLALAGSVSSIEPVHARSPRSGSESDVFPMVRSESESDSALAVKTAPIERAEESTNTEPASSASDEAPDDDPDRQIIDMPLPPPNASVESVRATMRMSSDAVAARLSASMDARQISDAYRIVRPARPGASGVPEHRDSAPTPREIPLSSQSPRARTEPIDVEREPHRDHGSDRFSASYNAMDAHGVLSGEIEDHPLPEQSAPSTTSGQLTPLEVSAALELLERADDRDVIFSVLLRGLSRVADYVALLAVQGKKALGRMAIDHGSVENDSISTVLIPLEQSSPIALAAESGAPFIGSLLSGKPEIDELVERLGGCGAASAMLLPVSLRGRVVAIAVGHCGDKPVEVGEVSQVFPMAEAAAAALLRLILKAKKVTATFPTSEVPTEPAPPPTKNDLPDLSPRATATATPSVHPGPVRDEEIESLLDEIESDDAAVANRAMDALLGRSAEVVPHLDDRFPGKLRVDRYEVGWRTIRAGQYGQMMELVVQLGAACGPMLAHKLRDPRRDVRYYAAVCAAELRPEAALAELVARLFDRDYGVRDIAIHALGGYPVRELERALSVARHALDSDEDERVMAAANALSVLGDLGAIPALLDVIESGRELIEPARRALRRLTAQDFGGNVRKWRSWWNKNRARPRVEWLLDALSHKDDDLRRRAVDDLRTLTGESFGFQADASKRERELARRQWLEWWDLRGRHRFASDPRAERARETAKLPRI